MYAQCDIDGHQHLILDDIIDYKKDANAIAMTDRYQIIKGKKYLRKTIKRNIQPRNNNKGTWFHAGDIYGVKQGTYML